jgi:predicted ATPase/DNA-binding XRE family transcriptional regulator
VETIYSFGYWVRRRRKALDLTQRELAERVGCALITLKKIEADERRPSPQMAELLAQALAIPVGDHDAFIASARGERPVDTLGPPQQPIFHRLRDSIPSPTTPLVGREAELRTALALLERPDARLVTIAGPGGIGKTRLALAVGETLRERGPHRFPHGIFFIDLAAASTAADMAGTIAATLGFEPDQRNRDPQPLVRQLAEYLRVRDCLLILDNVEQIEGAAAAVHEWLRQSTGVCFLVTSRERLNLAGEHLLALPGLPCPAGEMPDPETYPAGRLFLARARRVRSGFVARESEWDALAGICRMVEGMPLALELAAGWVETLTTGEIAIELQRDLGLLAGDLVDFPDRHRSLDAVWASTWVRLDQETQAVFARLCIFRGGFTRTAAETVAGASLATLAQLTGHFLMTLERETGRYRIHELLRQYGLEQLGVSSAAADARRRHFDYYEKLLAGELPRMRGPEQLAVLAQLDLEQDNIHLALHWGLESPRDADRLARMMFDLHWYWRARSRVREGQEWAARALVQSGRSPAGEAALRFVAGHMVWMGGDYATARDHQLAALHAWQASDQTDLELAAHINNALGMVAFHEGHNADALQWQRRSLAIFQEMGDEWGSVFVLGQMGRVYQLMGDGDEGNAVMAEALDRGRRLGDPFLLAIFLSNAAYMALGDGDIARAAELAREAGVYQRATGHIHSLGQTLMMLGRYARQHGDEASARAYLEEALVVFQEIGNRHYIAEAESLLNRI